MLVNGPIQSESLVRRRTGRGCGENLVLSSTPPWKDACDGGPSHNGGAGKIIGC